MPKGRMLRFQSATDIDAIYAKRKAKAAGKPEPETFGSEHEMQVALFRWWDEDPSGSFRYGLPTYSLFAVPNGGHRHPAVGARMKAEGVRAGIPDVILAATRDGRPGLYLELKHGGGKPSERQNEVMAFLRSQGYITAMAWSLCDAKGAIADYLGARQSGVAELPYTRPGG